MRSEPCLTTACPAIGSATITATAMPTRISPTSADVRSKRSRIHGIWATQVPMTAPLTKKTPVVAQRADIARG